jgi:hypothetical protein
VRDQPRHSSSNWTPPQFGQTIVSSWVSVPVFFVESVVVAFSFGFDLLTSTVARARIELRGVIERPQARTQPSHVLVRSDSQGRPAKGDLSQTASSGSS